MARILVIDPNIEVEFTHWVDDFGYVICQGDYNTLMAQGSDARCKFCKASESSKAISQARRKFVTLILVYRTNKAGQVLQPVSFEFMPWIFGDDKFNDLVNKKSQWGDLRARDLMVECIGKQYQKLKMDVLPDTLWLKDNNLKAQVIKEFKDVILKYSKDLRILLGRDISDLEQIDKIVADAVGTVPVPAYAAPADISSILNNDAPVVPTTTVPEIDFSALLNSGSAPVGTPVNTSVQSAVTQPVVTAPNIGAAVADPNIGKIQPDPVTPTQAETPAPVQAGTINFDDLLNT